MISAESLTRPSKEEKNTSAAKEWFSSIFQCKKSQNEEIIYTWEYGVSTYTKRIAQFVGQCTLGVAF